jgi:hypothetical protein
VKILGRVSGKDQVGIFFLVHFLLHDFCIERFLRASNDELK